jgi:hypothetical protein
MGLEMTVARVVVVHGIQEGGVSEVQGYGQHLLRGLKESGERLPSGLRVDLREAIWADIAEDWHGDIPPGLDSVADLAAYAVPDVGWAIRQRVREVIEDHRPCIVVAHSLGSVVVRDVEDEIVSEGGWEGSPIQGLITLGSPLGLGPDDVLDGLEPWLDYATARVARLERILEEHGPPARPWVNAFDRNDPVTSGSLFGRASQSRGLERWAPYQRAGAVDIAVETGFHLLAHLFERYATNEVVVGVLRGMLSRFAMFRGGGQ